MSRRDIWIAIILGALAIVLGTLGSARSIPEVVEPALEPHYLPESWEPDDDNGIDDALRFLRNGTLRPADFIEAGFPKYYVAIVYAAVYRTSGRDLDALYAGNPGAFVREAYVTGFAVSALFFALAVVFVYLTARRCCTAFASLCAALLVALNSGIVTHAHFAVFDVHLLFFEALLFFLIVRGSSPVRQAVAAGLMAATKYTGLLLFPIIPGVVCARTGTRPHARSLALWVLAVGVTFFVLNPYALIELPRFVHDLGVIYFTRSMFKGFQGTSLAFSTHLVNLSQTGLFFAVASLAALGSALLTKRRSELQTSGLIGFFTIYLLTGWSRQNAMRFSLPLCLPLALLAAPFVDRLMGKTRRWTRAIMCLGLLWSFAECCETVSMFYRDSRIQARSLVDQKGYRTVGSLGRMAYVQPAIPVGSLRQLRLGQPAPKQPDLYYRAQALYRRIRGLPPAETPPVRDSTMDYYSANRDALDAAAPDALVLSSFDVLRYFSQPAAYPQTTRFLQDLTTGKLGYRLVARFQTRTYLIRHVEFLNPEILVLERQKDP
ncbi:MAG: phospholipid carrier-dependent glycosyltransferase [Acidobacteriota bacterium]